MRIPLPLPGLGRRVLRMSLTWLFLGAVVGALNGLDNGGEIGLIAMMIGGMISLPIVGLFLGLIGGDARGSVAGAMGALIGCWLARAVGGPAIPPAGMGLAVVFCALVGATGFLFLRFLVWKYTIVFRALAWFAGITPIAAKASAFAGNSPILRRSARYLGQLNTPSMVRRSRVPGRLSEARPSGG